MPCSIVKHQICSASSCFDVMKNMMLVMLINSVSCFLNHLTTGLLEGFEPTYDDTPIIGFMVHNIAAVQKTENVILDYTVFYNQIIFN